MIDFRKIVSNMAVKNGIWLYILQFFNTVIPLITVPYVTRILGAEGYGAFSIVLNLSIYLQVLVEYGFGLSATRRVVLCKDQKELDCLFASVILSRVLLFLLAGLIAGGYILLFQPSVIAKRCLLILMVSVFAYSIQENWLFQGKQEMKYITIAGVVARGVTTACIFSFVHRESDLLLYCFLYALSPVISNILGTVISVRRYQIHWARISFANILEALRGGLYVFFTQLSAKVFGAIGVTFLGIFTTEYVTGIYSALYKIPYLLVLIWAPISQIIYPISSKKIIADYSDGVIFIRKIEKYCLLVFGFMAVVIALLAKTVSPIFGQEYGEYYYIIFPLLVWGLLGIHNNFSGIQILVGSGHDKEYGFAFEIGVIITILLNYILIKRIGLMGAAVAPAISELLLSILLYIQGKRVVNKMEK